MGVNIISTTLTNASQPEMVSLFRGDVVSLVLQFSCNEYAIKKINIVDGTYNGVQDTVDDPIDGVYTYEGLFNAYSNQVHYELIDDRNVVVYYGIFTVPYLDYYQPDFHAYHSGITYNASNVGETTVHISVVYWDNEYQTISGTVVNKIKIQAGYRRVGDSTWTQVSLQNPSQGIPGGSYNTSFKMPSLEYGEPYQVRFFIEDNFTAIQEEIDVVSESLFDWNASNFRFNIPVECQKSVTFQPGTGISGYTTSGGKQLFTYDNNGNLYVGLGNYTQEDGTTYICGDDIQFMSNQTGVTLDMKTLWQINSALTNSFNLTVTTATNGGGTVMNVTPSCTAILRGNTMYVRFRCVANSGTLTSSTGDLSDVYLATLTINHGGRIADFDDVIAGISTSGTVAALELRRRTNGSTAMQYDVYLTGNTEGATSVVYTTFNVPVTLNLNNY